MDLMPPFAKLAGPQVPIDRVIDGKDIWPTLAGKERSPHEAFYYHAGNTLQAVRSRNWKLHLRGNSPRELYNLESDIGETKNVIKQHPEVVRRLKDSLQRFEVELAENSRPAAFVSHPKALSLESSP